METTAETLPAICRECEWDGECPEGCLHIKKRREAMKGSVVSGPSYLEIKGGYRSA